MRFSTERATLASAVQNVLNIIPLKTTMPVLSNILLEASREKVILKATDLDVSISTEVDLEVEEEGGIALPGKKFAEILRELPEAEVTIAEKEDRVEIRCQQGIFVLMGMSPDEFPQLPSVISKRKLTLSSAELGRMIQKTTFAVSSDETRPSLNGVLWQIQDKEMRMVATDGHRLAKVVLRSEVEREFSEEVIIPPKALNQLVRLFQNGEMDVDISLTENHMVFQVGKTVLYSRLIQGPYPNYEAVIPKDNDKKLVVDRDALTSALRRVSLLSNAVTHQISFSLQKDTLELSTTNPDFGGEARELLPARYEGDNMVIGYNVVYVAEVLKHVESNEVLFELSAPLKAGLVKPTDQREGEEYLYLVMPLRLAG